MTEPQHSPTSTYDPADEYRPEPPKPPEPPAWVDGSVRIGIHTSIAGDIAGSLEIAHKLGCNALQIFSASPRMWPQSLGSVGAESTRRIVPADAAHFRQRREALRLGPLVVHDNYLINLAARLPVLRTRSIQAFHDELLRAVALGAEYLVAHPGNSGGSDHGEAIERVASSLRQAARGARGLSLPDRRSASGSFGGLRILLENTSGQGSSLGSRFEELKAILDACPELPLGVCLDTAHMFEAGYDIRSPEGLERTLEAIEGTIGLARVFVVHVNDSKTPLGSRVDRHAHIGRGHIGLEAFRRILNHPLLAVAPTASGVDRAFILETPIDKPGDDRRNVRTLWKLVGKSAKQQPEAGDGFKLLRRTRARAGSARRRKTAADGKPTRRKMAKHVALASSRSR